MATLTEFHKAAAKSALAYAKLQQKTEVYDAALKELQLANKENDEALEEVKSLVATLDQDAIAQLQLT